MNDLLTDPSMIFLGSRLKRLAERFQAGAVRTLSEIGIPIQLAHLPLLTAIAENATTISQLIEMVGGTQPGVARSVGQLIDQGLVRSTPGADRRERYLELTNTGITLMNDTKARLWPCVAAAMTELCAPLSKNFADDLAKLEAALRIEPLDQRVMRVKASPLKLVEYDDSLAGEFRNLNTEWIEAMFALEGRDRDVLENPKERIIEAGGMILFVHHDTLGIIGTGALQKHANGYFEVTKMAVRADARGLKAGEFILRALIDRAAKQGIAEIFLLSNHKCIAAVNLYEKAGFIHDTEIMQEYGKTYERCDVAMRYQIL